MLRKRRYVVSNIIAVDHVRLTGPEGNPILMGLGWGLGDGLGIGIPLDEGGEPDGGPPFGVIRLPGGIRK